MISPHASVRSAAAEQLRQRPRESFVPALLSVLYTPAVSRLAAVQTRDGRLLQRYAVQREGQNHRETLVLDTAFVRVALPGGDGAETMFRCRVRPTPTT